MFEIDIVVPAEMHLCFGERRSALFFGRNLKSEVRFLMRTQNVFLGLALVVRRKNTSLFIN